MFKLPPRVVQPVAVKDTLLEKLYPKGHGMLNSGLGMKTGGIGSIAGKLYLQSELSVVKLSSSVGRSRGSRVGRVQLPSGQVVVSFNLKSDVKPDPARLKSMVDVSISFGMIN